MSRARDSYALICLFGKKKKSYKTDYMDPIAQQLPSTLRDWRDRRPYDYPEDWYKPWEDLRPFFLQRGYDLFRPQTGGELSIPNGTPSPSLDSFGLYGDRGDGFCSDMGRVSLDFLPPLAFSLIIPSSTLWLSQLEIG